MSHRVDSLDRFALNNDPDAPLADEEVLSDSSENVLEGVDMSPELFQLDTEPFSDNFF